MKEFPLDSLLSATDLEKIKDSLVLVFSHITKKLKLSPYPIRRALPLVEAISKDFNEQLVRLLTSYRLTYQPYESFERILNQTKKCSAHGMNRSRIHKCRTRCHKKAIGEVHRNQNQSCTCGTRGESTLYSRLEKTARTAVRDDGSNERIRWH